MKVVKFKTSFRRGVRESSTPQCKHWIQECSSIMVMAYLISFLLCTPSFFLKTRCIRPASDYGSFIFREGNSNRSKSFSNFQNCEPFTYILRKWSIFDWVEWMAVFLLLLLLLLRSFILREVAKSSNLPPVTILEE